MKKKIIFENYILGAVFNKFYFVFPAYSTCSQTLATSCIQIIVLL